MNGAGRNRHGRGVAARGVSGQTDEDFENLADAANEARQREIAALQKQLQLAQQQSGAEAICVQ